MNSIPTIARPQPLQPCVCSECGGEVELRVWTENHAFCPVCGYVWRQAGTYWVLERAA